MSLFHGSSDNVPKSIRASTAVALENKIRKLQNKRAIEVRLISVYHDGKEHVAWYYDNIELMLMEKTKGARNGNSEKSEEST